MLGKAKEEIPETGTFIWIDVRDLALAHVKAMELDAAQGKRFFVTAGYFSNKEIAKVVGKNFPEYKDNMPSDSTKGGDYPEGGVFKIDNSRVQDVLGLKFRSFEQCITDTVKSLKDIKE